MDIWEQFKQDNEATYGEYCEHRDRIVVPKNPIKDPKTFEEYHYNEGWIIECRTCGHSEDWLGKDYHQKFPKVKYEKTNNS